jgi:hypothetical protein
LELFSFFKKGENPKKGKSFLTILKKGKKLENAQGYSLNFVHFWPRFSFLKKGQQMTRK